ncbi:hypothetical protein [Acidovorax sp.]|uniref:hypothetical protein n=1 Tax=Acidovorax sp. TaxID=1872122 RepID=UPI00391F2DDE
MSTSKKLRHIQSDEVDRDDFMVAVSLLEEDCPQLKGLENKLIPQFNLSLPQCMMGLKVLCFVTAEYYSALKKDFCRPNTVCSSFPFLLKKREKS